MSDLPFMSMLRHLHLQLSCERPIIVVALLWYNAGAIYEMYFFDILAPRLLHKYVPSYSCLMQRYVPLYLYLLHKHVPSSSSLMLLQLTIH